jgi:hypothetical protein
LASYIRSTWKEEIKERQQVDPPFLDLSKVALLEAIDHMATVRVKLGVLLILAVAIVAGTATATGQQEAEDGTIVMAGAGNGVCDYRFEISTTYRQGAVDGVIFGLYDIDRNGWTREVSITPADPFNLEPFVIAREACINPCRLTLRLKGLGRFLPFNVRVQVFDYSTYTGAPTVPIYDFTFDVTLFVTNQGIDIDRCKYSYV